MVQAFRDICQLSELKVTVLTKVGDSESLNEKLTSWNRFASGCVSINVLMLPLVIHSDTMTNRLSVMTTPISSNTLGCLRDFHVITSL